MFNPSTGRYEPGWRPGDDPFHDAEGVPMDPGLVEGEGEGRWKDIINTKTGEHSVKEHRLKLVKQWCKPDEHFYIETNPQTHEITCEKCGMETRYVLGMYKLAGFSGSRSAGPIFAAWSVMNYLGEEGYLRLTRRLLELKQRFTEGVSAIEGLKFWDVDVMPMQFHSERAPTSAVYQGLLEKGWLMLGLVKPEAITICVDPALSDDDVALFLKDLREVTEKILAGGDATAGTIRYG